MTTQSGQDEIVLIDAAGAAHPHGEVAARRLGSHEGAYRVMPTPRHVVFLRHIGADGRRDPVDEPVVRLAGEITAAGALCDVLAILGQSGWRGELVVTSADTTRRVFFDHGDIVGVCSDAEEDHLARVMYRYGALTEEQVALVRERERAGEAFAGESFVRKEQMYRFLGLQIEEVVLAALMLTDGMFCFLDGFDEARLTSRRVINTNALLMDHVSRLDEIRYFRPWIPSPEHIPVQTPGKAADDEFAAVWAAIDGHRSVEQIGRLSGLGEFVVTKQLVHLAQSGLVTLRPPRLLGGVAEAVELADAALRLIHRAADGGGCGDALRHSLAEFAAGSYDQLLRGAGPRNGGGLHGEPVAANAAAMNLREVEVREMLYDYVAFALFSATASMRGTATPMIVAVEPYLVRLRPKGQSGIYVCPATR